jgi:hypothetical protein
MTVATITESTAANVIAKAEETRDALKALLELFKELDEMADHVSARFPRYALEISKMAETLRSDFEENDSGPTMFDLVGELQDLIDLAVFANTERGES